MQTSALTETNKKHTVLWRCEGDDSSTESAREKSTDDRSGALLDLATTISDLLRRCATALIPGRIQCIKLTDERLRLCYLGDGRQLPYIRDLIFPKGSRLLEQSQVHATSLTKELRRNHQADVLVTDFDFPLASTLLRGRHSSPAWVKQKVSLPTSWEQYLTQLRRKTRREAQRMIRKNCLSARVVPGSEFAEEFYFRLYKPYIERRHGEQAIVMPFKHAQRALQACKIIQLLHKGNIIAAAQLTRSADVLGIGWTGLSEECETGELRGAADTLDYFSMRYAIESGCRVLDMGHSRPHLKDGVLRYKKKWGANIELGKVPQSQISLVAQQPTQAVVELLAALPMLIVRRKRAHAWAVLTASTTTENYVREAQELQISGVHKMTLFLPATASTDVETALENALSITCRVLRYKDAAELLEHLQHDSSYA